MNSNSNQWPLVVIVILAVIIIVSLSLIPATKETLPQPTLTLISPTLTPVVPTETPFIPTETPVIPTEIPIVLDTGVVVGKEYVPAYEKVDGEWTCTYPEHWILIIETDDGQSKIYVSEDKWNIYSLGDSYDILLELTIELQSTCKN